MRPSDKTTMGHEGPALGVPAPVPDETRDHADAAGSPPAQAQSDPPPPDPLLPEAQHLGRFRIVRKLGAGGMGVVYEAIDTEHGGRVALKTLRAATPRATQRFKNEFRALADLSHDNVIELRELHATGEQLFFTMELVVGIDVLRWVVAPGAISGWSQDDDSQTPQAGPDYDRVRRALRGLVQGVDAVHRHGKLHRDLKPSNVLVTDSGRVVVLDFGLVRDTDAREDDSLTMSGMVMGTPAYMSPEQADGRAIGPASDWYAVGVMLYQALTGLLPHSDQETDIGLMVARATRSAPDPRERVPQTPAPLARLCMALLARDPSDRPAAAQILAELPGGNLPEPTSTPTRIESPLLGRDAALATLHTAYNSASLGHTVVALVEGPSGIGKSAIVDHFLRSLRRRDGDAVVVLRGRCYERESVPYKALDPIIDHLTRHLRRLPAADVAALLPRGVHALTRLFPALLDVNAIDKAPRRAPAEPQELRTRAFSALQELLGRITDRQPLVVHIDDLQWTDDDSATLLAELLRPPNAPSLLLVATFRQDDATEANSSLARLISALTDTRPRIDIQRITVGPLPHPQATMLTSLLLREHKLPESLADRLATECEGNPLFAGELVRHLAATAAASDIAPQDLTSPRLSDVLRERIAGLPKAARRVLQAVAVAGRRLPQSVVLAAAHVAEDDADPIARLRSEHFVHTVGRTGARVIESYHDRIRQATVDSMSATDRTETHRGLAAALLARRDADPEDLLHHYRSAGDETQARQFAIAAADRAVSQFAFERAADLLALALALGVDDRATLHRRRGEALAHAGHGHEAAGAFQAAAALEDGAAQLDLKRRAAVQLLLAGYSEEGRAELAEVLAAYAIPMPTSRRTAVAGLLLRRARLKLRGMGWKENNNIDPATLARVDTCWDASRGLVISDIIEGGYYQAEHLLQALSCGEPTRVAAALSEEAKSASYFGERGLTRARSLLQQVRELARRIDTPEARANALGTEGLVLLMGAQWTESLEKNREAETLIRDTCPGVHAMLFDTMTCQAAALYSTGDMPALEAVCRRTARDATLRCNIYHAALARLFLASPVALAQGQLEYARSSLEEGAAFCGEHGIQAAEIHILNARCAVGMYANQSLEAYRAQEPAFVAMAKNPLMRASYALTEVSSWRGRLALAAADEDQAERTRCLALAKQLAKTLLGLSYPSAAPMGHALRAGVAFVTGDKTQAESDLRTAGDRFEALGMMIWAAATRRRLGALIGGDTGFIMGNRAELVMTQAGVQDFDAFTRLWAPGFDH